MKQYLGIILSILYALTIRIIAEFNWIEINSYTYLIVTPMIMGFIPFFIKDQTWSKSLSKSILYPLLSVLAFLTIAVIAKLEDLLCYLILGIPYILVSIIISVALYEVYKKKDNKITKNGLPLLLIPFLLGPIEKKFSKVKSEYSISNQIIIERDRQIIWGNLYAVPNLEKTNTKSIVNYLGVPQPLRSTYDPKTNIRLGYFENNIVLHEKVSKSIDGKQITFKIDTEQSTLSNSPTLKHLIKGKNLEFDYIQYDLETLKNGHTLLKLSAKFSINSNLQKYGEYWSSLIINDFEKNLLLSLKTTLE